MTKENKNNVKILGLTINPRKEKLSSVIGIADSVLTSGYLITEPVAIVPADKTTEVIETPAEVLERLCTEADKETITLQGKTHKVADVVGAMRKIPVDKSAVIVDGRGRGIGYAIAVALGYTGDIATVQWTSKSVDISLAGNVVKGLVNRVSGNDVCGHACKLYSAGTIKTEAELIRAGALKRGLGQRAFAVAQLVNDHGVTLKDAVKLNKEQARDLLKALSAPDADSGALIDMALKNVAGKEPTILSRKQVMELAKYSDNMPQIAELLLAIADGSLLRAQTALAGLPETVKG